MAVLAEQPFFFGDSREPLFGVLHPPAGVSLGFGVLACAPFAHENGFAHRMLVEWARALAGAGVHVLRFDYRGHGDSAGAFEDYTVDHHLEDVIAAEAELEKRSGVPCRGLFGVRLGATLAARAAAKLARDHFLILWEPLVQGDKYLDEILRVVMSKDVASSGKPRTRAELRNVLTQGGDVLLEGHALTSATYKSLMAIDLSKEPPPSKSPSLILQLPSSKTAATRKDLEQLRAHFASAGAASELKVVQTPCLWWGPLTREYDARLRPRPVFDETLAWLRANATRFASAKQAPDAPKNGEAAHPYGVANELGERPLGFEVEGVPVYGVLHEPKLATQRRAAVVMLPQGMNRRTGWNRLYVRIARELARRGYPTLRFDARGFGDSGGTVELATGEDVFVAVQKGLHVPDSTRAIDVAQRFLGARPFVIVGVCGGAVTAGLMLPDDRRLSGVALIETELTYTTLVQETEPAYRIMEKLRSPEAWKKILSLKADYRKHARSLLGLAKRRLMRLRHRARAADRLDWLVDALGQIVNRPLFSALLRGFERRAPVLFVFGSTENDKAFMQVKDRFLASSPDVRAETIAGADHDFLDPEHARALCDLLGGWLDDPARPWADPHASEIHAAPTRPHHSQL